jgi:hypothetical protein
MAIIYTPPERPPYLSFESSSDPGKPPRAATHGAVQSGLSSAIRRLQKQLFSFVRTYEDVTGTGATSSSINAKTEVWRGRFVAGLGTTGARVFLYHGDKNNASTTINPRIHVAVQDVTAAGSFVEYTYSTGALESNVLYPIDKLRYGELRIPLVEKHVYNVKVSVEEYATPLAVVGVSESAYFESLAPPAVEELITDERLLELRSDMNDAWCYNGAQLYNFAPFGSKTIDAAGGFTSFASIHSVPVTIPWVLRSRVSKGAKIKLAAYATCAAAAADRLRLTNASGSITLQIGGSASPAWYEIGGRLTGSDESVFVQASRNGSDWTLYAIAAYLMED